MRFQSRRGSSHPLAKFSPREVEEIRCQKEQSPGRSLRSMAEERKCSPYTIYRILHHMSYQDDDEW